MSSITLLLAVVLAQESPQTWVDLAPELVLAGHEADAYDIAVSSKGRIASAGFDGTARVHDLEGRPLATLRPEKGRVFCVSFDASGEVLAMGGDDRVVRLWSLPAGGIEPVELGGLAPPFLAAAAQNGSTWLISREAVLVRGPERGFDPIRSASPARAVALAPMGSTPNSGAAARLGSDGRLEIFRLRGASAGAASSARLVDIGSAWRFLRGRAAPPEGWTAIGFDDASWETGAGGFGYSNLASELESVRTRLDDMAGDQGYTSVFTRTSFDVAETARVKAIALEIVIDDGFVAYLNGVEVARRNVEGSPPAHDRSAIRAAEPEKVTIDLSEHGSRLVAGKNVLAIQGHNASRASSDFVLSAALTVELSAGAAAEATLETAATLEGIDADIVAIDGDASRIAYAVAATVTVISASGERVLEITRPSPVSQVAFAGAQRVVTGEGSGALAMYDLASTGTEPRVLTAHSGRITSIAVSADGELIITAGAEGGVRVHRAANGELVRTIEGAADDGLRAAALDATSVAVLRSSGEVSAVEIASGQIIDSGKLGEGTSLLGAAPGSIWVARSDGVASWRPGAARLLAASTGHEGVVHGAAFSPDGSTLVTAGGDKTLRFWKVPSGEAIRSVAAHDSSVYCVAWQPGGELVASGGYDSKVKLWSSATGELVKTWSGHMDGVTKVVFTPDGRYVFSAGFDKTIRRWNLEADTSDVFEGHPGWVMGLAVSRDGRMLVSADYGGHVLRLRLADGGVEGRFRVRPVVYDLELLDDGRAIVADRTGSVGILRFPGP
jgi:WD40 repeat protein